MQAPSAAALSGAYTTMRTCTHVKLYTDNGSGKARDRQGALSIPSAASIPESRHTAVTTRITPFCPSVTRSKLNARLLGALALMITHTLPLAAAPPAAKKTPVHAVKPRAKNQQQRCPPGDKDHKPRSALYGNDSRYAGALGDGSDPAPTRRQAVLDVEDRGDVGRLRRFRL